VLYRCLSENLSFKNGGGNVLTLCPPLTIAETDLAQALEIVVRAIRAEAG
jgi:4-aminobutyrate aminotransferase